MLLTEKKAMNMPCPMVVSHYGRVMCSASGCPAWRWAKHGHVLKLMRRITELEGGTWIGDKEFVGYCGLAGRPD